MALETAVYANPRLWEACDRDLARRGHANPDRICGRIRCRDRRGRPIGTDRPFTVKASPPANPSQSPELNGNEVDMAAL